MACEPRAYAARTCIVGRRSKPEIAKPISQFAQITRRMAQADVPADVEKGGAALLALSR